MILVHLFRRYLRVKVISLMFAILILGFGVLLILNIRREAEVLVASNRETALLLGASIQTSLKNGMMEGRPDIIRRLVGELKAELEDVRRLDVYRRNGVEAFSDLETLNEVKRTAGLEEDVIEGISRMSREPGERITNPLFTRAVETMVPQETYETNVRGRMLTFFLPLPNLVECQECHGEDHQVRGVLRVSLGLDKLDAELRAAWNRQLIVALLTILGVTGTLVVLMSRVMLQPVARVVAAAREYRRGNFGTRVEVQSQDEIGELGRVINDMADGLSTAHDRLRTARDDLEARNIELSDVLERLKESIRKVQLLEQVKGELVKFVPESVTRLLEKDPNARELEKHEADVSVLFLDIEGYTKLSEELPPQRLNRLIQDYFSSFLEIIRAQGGDVNETAGDGLMVIFQSEESPMRHALNAASAAFQIESRLAELNREFAGIYPPVSIHVGINSGTAFVGATKLDAGRWTFTASGPTTNVAARIAALAKGGEIMVGPETAERIKNHYVLEDAGEHRLKNVSEPIQVARLVPPGMYSKVMI